jgi:hypothetical protein
VTPIEGMEFMLAHGFAVGPLDGKRATLTGNGIHDFSRDRDVIARWARKYPGCNWGCTQPGVLALDVDPRHGGSVAALKLRSEHATLTIRTGGGGWHLFYRYSGPVRGKVQGVPGIDVKAGGSGYLVAPGSIHPITSKPYRQHRDAPIAQCPEHIWALIAQPAFAPPSGPVRVPASGDRWDGLIRTVADAQEGGRNAALFWAAARAAADGAPAAVYSALAAAAHGIGLGAHEIQQTIQSAQRKATA